MSEYSKEEQRWVEFLDMKETRGVSGTYLTTTEGRRTFNTPPGYDLPEGLTAASLLSYDPMTRKQRKDLVKKAKAFAAKLSDHQKMQIINSK